MVRFFDSSNSLDLGSYNVLLETNCENPRKSNFSEKRQNGHFGKNPKFF